MTRLHATLQSEHDLTTEADVLVLGGGPAGCWAALTAARAGASVVLAEKGLVGTGGATAAGNTTMIHAAPRSPAREDAIKRRLALAFGLAERWWIERVIDEGYLRLNELADEGYPYPVDEAGASYRGSLRGVDYLRFMRRRLRKAGVRILDQSPALELLMHDGVAAGAVGFHRLTRTAWECRAGAVVVATGGCAFLSKALGTNGLTGDGYLMAAEAGAAFSGMEFTGQYGIAPAFTSVTKGIMYFWATFCDQDGNVLESKGDRQSVVAENLLRGPVYAVIDRAGPRLQEGMRRGQPNMFLPFDRMGIDPFTQRFPVTLRYEGTVRGVGGLIVDRDGATTVPGLYAAGDAASREALVGASTGGGGPNATWAMASGSFAGRAAAAFATLGGLRRGGAAIGGAGLRPTEREARDVDAHDLIAAVQADILPLDKSYFRTAASLAGARERLDGLWHTARSRLGAGSDPVRARETAAMIATARWIVAAAAARPEQRGLNRRIDCPPLDPEQERRLGVGGLDEVWVEPEGRAQAMAS